MAHFRSARRFLASVVVSILASSLTGCVESTFVLANDSQLPQSIIIPPGLTRKDISVTLNLYAPLKGADAQFVLNDLKGTRLEQVQGKTHKLSQSTDFQITTKKGKTETIRLKPYQEHQNMEQNGRAVALFYVLDGQN